MKRYIFILALVFAAAMVLRAEDETVTAEKTVTAGEIKAVKNFTPEEKAEVKTAVEEKIKDVIDKKASANVKKPSKQYMKLSKKLFKQSALELKKGETAQATVTAGQAQAEATKEAISNSRTAREEQAISTQTEKDQVNKDLKDVKEEIQERKDVNKNIQAQETEVPNGSTAGDSKEKVETK